MSGSFWCSVLVGRGSIAVIIKVIIIQLEHAEGRARLVAISVSDRERSSY
jgi:hypothetical protein